MDALVAIWQHFGEPVPALVGLAVAPWRAQAAPTCLGSGACGEEMLLPRLQKAKPRVGFGPRGGTEGKPWDNISGKRGRVPAPSPYPLPALQETWTNIIPFTWLIF